jgi:archaeal cell division control protein 6
MGIVEDELGATSVFSDRSKLDFSFVPPALPHRDEEMRTLATQFRVVLEQGGSQSVFVTGSVGTGKTVLSRKFCAEFVEAARKKGMRVDTPYVNCRNNASEGLVLHQILKTFDPNYPERGFSTNEMLRDLRKHLDRRQSNCIVILDEADALVAKEGSDIVYAMTRFDGERGASKSTLSLILVSAQGHLPLMLDEAARSTLGRSKFIELKKYNERQLFDIVKQRAELAFRKGTVRSDVMELIAEIAAAEGDARYAIELLDIAGRAADADDSQAVVADYVRAAKAHTHSFVTESKLRLLAQQQLLVLKAIARKLARSKTRTFLTTGEAEEIYQLVAEEHGEKPRGHTQFWKYLNELAVAGWIGLRAAERTAESGNTQNISLPDIPPKELLGKIDEVLGDSGGA